MKTNTTAADPMVFAMIDAMRGRVVGVVGPIGTESAMVHVGAFALRRCSHFRVDAFQPVCAATELRKLRGVSVTGSDDPGVFVLGTLDDGRECWMRLEDFVEDFMGTSLS